MLTGAYWYIGVRTVQDNRENCAMASLFVLVIKHYQGDLKKKRMELPRNVARMGKMRKVPNILVNNPQWKIRECWRRLKDGTK